MNRVVLMSLVGMIAISIGQSVLAATELVADFDSFPEGVIGFEFTDGGIHFSKLDRRFLTPTLSKFCIDDATNQIWPPHTPPHYLTFGGFAPGPGAGFGRYSSMEISIESMASSAKMDLFTPSGSYVLLKLTAYFDDTIVATSTVDTRQATQLSSFARHSHISITGDRFNRLMLSTTDFYGTPTYVGLGVDNVSFVVPEPCSVTGLVIPLMLIASRSRIRRYPTS